MQTKLPVISFYWTIEQLLLISLVKQSFLIFESDDQFPWHIPFIKKEQIVISTILLCSIKDGLQIRHDEHFSKTKNELMNPIRSFWTIVQETSPPKECIMFQKKAKA